MAMMLRKVRFSWTEQKEEKLTALWKQHECLYDVSSELKNAAVAKSCLSVISSLFRVSTRCMMGNNLRKSLYSIFSLRVKTLRFPLAVTGVSLLNTSLLELSDVREAFLTFSIIGEIMKRRKAQRACVGVHICSATSSTEQTPHPADQPSNIIS